MNLAFWQLNHSLEVTAQSAFLRAVDGLSHSRKGQAEIAHDRIELGGFFEVTNVPGPGDNREPCSGYRIAKLVRDVHR